MCKHVKSIEIIEFGYENSEEGTNGAKSEYCVDKQKLNITRPYQAALREATVSRAGRRRRALALHDYWITALAALKWRSGETDDDYKARTGRSSRPSSDRGRLAAHDDDPRVRDSTKPATRVGRARRPTN